STICAICQTTQRSLFTHLPHSHLWVHDLSKITALIEAGAIRPVLDRVFPFEAANDALAYVETGRAKGKVVIKVR
ncbi:zinc-binding dehydrogenase, partial [Mesorhizobium sp. M0306]|uniref:zinc-binding dehydrogenase n=1 Tax=Mesorhizobium sp. M0306 TaxID=2956932 RepID=UPI00333C2E64